VGVGRVPPGLEKLIVGEHSRCEGIVLLALIRLLGSSVNKDKIQGPKLLDPGPFSCALCSLLRAALFYQSTCSLKRTITQSSLSVVGRYYFSVALNGRVVHLLGGR
jgi:hypothetical protein